MTPAGALVPRLHDAGAGTGDRHEASGRHLPAEIPGLPILGGLGPDACRAEDAHLADPSVAAQDLEGVAHLLQRRIDDLQVSPLGAIRTQLQRGGDHLADQRSLGADALLVQMALDGCVQFGVRDGVVVAHGSPRDSPGLSE